VRAVSRYLKALLILSLLVAPARGQAQTQPGRKPSVADGGPLTLGPTSVASAPTQSGGGTFSLEGAIGQSSATVTGGTFVLQGALGMPLGGESSGGAFTVKGDSLAAPLATFVKAVVRAGASPAVQNSSAAYTVTFTAPVTGVDATDFQLTTAGLTGAGVTDVTGSGTTYNVVVNTGTPTSAGATLRLDVADDDTVKDSANAPLGGAGAGNGNYTSGEVYAVSSLAARANDAAAAEPASGSTQMLFAVTLDNPAPAGGLSLGYATADGTAAGGGSCGGATDYVTTGGTLNFAEGQRLKTVAVTVCADGSASEAGETLLLNISGASPGGIADAQAVGTITQGTTQGTLLISELRTSGPGGAGDDFVELYNNTDSEIDISGYGLFKTGADCSAPPVLAAAVPGAPGSNTTKLKARGHYLLTGSEYSLAHYGGTDAARGDQALSSDLDTDANVGLFPTGDVNLLSTAARLDAVGFGANTGGTCDLLREGPTLPSIAAAPATEHAFFRKLCDFAGVCTTAGNPKDTGDNSADFTFADTQATAVAGVPTKLGAPGPENLSSPVRMDNKGLVVELLDRAVASAAPPNRTRTLGMGDPNTSMFGSMTVRRRVVNNTGSDVSRLRFRIIELTTKETAPGAADLRALTPSPFVDESVFPVNDAGTCLASNGVATTPCTVTVKPTALEEPPAQTSGGGLNSTLSAVTVSLGSKLESGKSINVSFKLGVMTTGTFRFLIIVEALP